MFSYPKLVWRIRLTRDLSVRISLWETIVGIWVWLLCSKQKKITIMQQIESSLRYLGNMGVNYFSVTVNLLWHRSPVFLRQFWPSWAT
jgi:hypothetical protein